VPAHLERDVLTNKGTFFAAKREDQLVTRRIEVLKTVPGLNALPLAELTARAASFLGVPAGR
jgi:hypothetical protein